MKRAVAATRIARNLTETRPKARSRGILTKWWSQSLGAKCISGAPLTAKVRFSRTATPMPPAHRDSDDRHAHQPTNHRHDRTQDIEHRAAARLAALQEHRAQHRT